MFNISSLLEKFSKNLINKEYDKKQLLIIINTETGILIEPENLEFKNDIIYIKSSPGVKNKIFILKNKIIEEIKLKTALQIVDIK